MQSRGVTLAFDGSFADIACLLRDLETHEGLSGVKIGAYAALQSGLATAVKQIRTINSSWYLMYDHQKAGTDVPDMSGLFAKGMHEARVDAAIVYPLSGPKTQRSLIAELAEVGVSPLVGGAMTHDGFFSDEGGYISTHSPGPMYQCSAEFGVNAFVMPGNRTDLVDALMNLVLRHIPIGEVAVFAPGIHSLCELEKLCLVLRPYPVQFSPIIGRMITDASDPVSIVTEINDILESR